MAFGFVTHAKTPCQPQKCGEPCLIIEFRRWGNSLSVRTFLRLWPMPSKQPTGKRAEIKIENGTLVLHPIVKPARKSRNTLEELLSGMTRDNVPQEVEWGLRRGNEVW